MDVNSLIQKFGLLGIFLIVFAESGLLVGFVLPGDSLLFAAGVWAAKHPEFASIYELCGVVILAAIIGDTFGYEFGKLSGTKFTKKNTGFIANRGLIPKAINFYDTHGPLAIVLARFVPAVRTFVPIIAGVVKMQYRRFIKFNIFGGILWGILIPVLGYGLGAKYPWLEKNLEKIMIVPIAITLLPLMAEFVRYKIKGSRASKLQG